mmetsp:Transcript_96143/g.222893  ORF Transcript_96143/g.222893 Transcript_96143/m.222893 type:complete len:217 (-) Transcript_96143:756-1406(-)
MPSVHTPSSELATRPKLLLHLLGDEVSHGQCRDHGVGARGSGEGGGICNEEALDLPALTVGVHHTLLGRCPHPARPHLVRTEDAGQVQGEAHSPHIGDKLLNSSLARLGHCGGWQGSEPPHRLRLCCANRLHANGCGGPDGLFHAIKHALLVMLGQGVIEPRVLLLVQANLAATTVPDENNLRREAPNTQHGLLELPAAEPRHDCCGKAWMDAGAL